MGIGYREARDRQGRTTLEMRVDRRWLLLLGSFLSGIVWMVLEGGWAGSIGAAVTVIVFMVAYERKKTGKVMDVAIDPQARTLSVGAGRGERVFQFAEIVRAQLNSMVRDASPHLEAHRVDLVLRSGEVLPLMEGFPGSDRDECLHIVDLIDKAIAHHKATGG